MGEGGAEYRAPCEEDQNLQNHDTPLNHGQLNSHLILVAYNKTYNSSEEIQKPDNNCNYRTMPVLEKKVQV